MKIAFICLTLFLIVRITNKEKKEFNWNWIQNDYMVEPGHLEVTRYNKRYVRHVSVRTFKFNRTCVANNFTVNFRVNVGNDLEVISQTYKSASNEYRLFPMRVGLKVCKGMATNIMGIGEIVKCGNFTSCKFLKDRTYHLCNYVLKDEKMPPLIPSGEYMLEMTFIFKEKEMYVLKAYGRIYRNITRK